MKIATTNKSFALSCRPPLLSLRKDEAISKGVDCSDKTLAMTCASVIARNGVMKQSTWKNNTTFIS